MSRYIIDRFEGEYAVCESESGEMKNIARALIAKNARPGDCLCERDGVFTVDEQRTAARREQIQRLQDKLFK